MLARVVNGYACSLVKRGVVECIVGTPPGACSLLQRGAGRFRDLPSDHHL